MLNSNMRNKQMPNSNCKSYKIKNENSKNKFSTFQQILTFIYFYCIKPLYQNRQQFQLSNQLSDCVQKACFNQIIHSKNKFVSKKKLNKLRKLRSFEKKKEIVSKQIQLI
ncbi:hypothetical protein ABPG72_012879 [Tetrahymena utriculariae]